MIPNNFQNNFRTSGFHFCSILKLQLKVCTSSTSKLFHFKCNVVECKAKILKMASLSKYFWAQLYYYCCCLKQSHSRTIHYNTKCLRPKKIYLGKHCATDYFDYFRFIKFIQQKEIISNKCKLRLLSFMILLKVYLYVAFYVVH